MTVDQDADDAHAENAPAYAFKPGMLGAPHEFRLRPSGLDWQVGRRSIHIPYGSIRRLRLSYRPVTLASYRFMAEIWSSAAPKASVTSTSWRNVFEQQRHDESYRAFIVELVGRIAAAGGKAAFVTGSVSILYWPGVAIFVGVSLALAALIARGLQAGQVAGAAVVGAFLAVFLWQLGNFLRRNRPGTFGPEALPEQVLPRG